MRGKKYCTYLTKKRSVNCHPVGVPNYHKKGFPAIPPMPGATGGPAVGRDCCWPLGANGKFPPAPDVAGEKYRHRHLRRRHSGTDWRRQATLAVPSAEKKRRTNSVDNADAVVVAVDDVGARCQKPIQTRRQKWK